MSSIPASGPLSGIEKLQTGVTSPGASRARSAVSGVQPATPETAAAAQATQGAAAAQPQAEAEVFNAPMLDLPDAPTTTDVLHGLTAAMADPTVNAGTAQKLYQLHEQLLNAERAMVQSIIDGMLM